MSFNASNTAAISSAVAVPSRWPNRCTDKVRIGPTFAQERFGRPEPVISTTKGKAARSSWLVSAKAIVVPERV